MDRHPEIIETTPTIGNVQELPQDVPTLQAEVLRLREEVRRLQEEALTDSLTGLPNRRYADQEIKTLFAQRGRNEIDSFSVIAFDLDGFKAINDKGGHLAGDECLKIVAEEIRNTLRTTDFFAREGGDEFLIFLRNEPHATTVAENVLKRMNDNVTTRLREYTKDETSWISASIGLVTIADDSSLRGITSSKDVLTQADYVRYVVKAAGKKGVFTLEQAREVDTDGRYWKQFVENKIGKVSV